MGDQFDLPPETITPYQLFVLLQALNTKMSLQLVHQQQQEERLQRLEKQNQDLYEAWQAAGALLKFVKYVAAVALAVGVILGVGNAILTWIRGG